MESNNEEKRINTDKFHEENKARFDDIAKTLEEQNITLEEIKKNNSDHYQHDDTFQQDTHRSIQELGKIVPIVLEQLLPAYVKEMERKRAYQIVEEDRNKFGEWGKFLLIIFGIISAFYGAFKVFTKL